MLKLVLLFLTISVANIRSRIVLHPNSRSNRLYYEPGCYVDIIDRMLAFNETFSPKDGKTCELYKCDYDGYTYIASCSILFEADCLVVPGNKSLAYPDCCDALDCSQRRKNKKTTVNLIPNNNMDTQNPPAPPSNNETLDFNNSRKNNNNSLVQNVNRMSQNSPNAELQQDYPLQSLTLNKTPNIKQEYTFDNQQQSIERVNESNFTSQTNTNKTNAVEGLRFGINNSSAAKNISENSFQSRTGGNVLNTSVVQTQSINQENKQFTYTSETQKNYTNLSENRLGNQTQETEKENQNSSNSSSFGQNNASTVQDQNTNIISYKKSLEFSNGNNLNISANKTNLVQQGEFEPNTSQSFDLRNISDETNNSFNAENYFGNQSVIRFQSEATGRNPKSDFIERVSNIAKNRNIESINNRLKAKQVMEQEKLNSTRTSQIKNNDTGTSQSVKDTEKNYFDAKAVTENPIESEIDMNQQNENLNNTSGNQTGTNDESAVTGVIKQNPLNSKTSPENSTLFIIGNNTQNTNLENTLSGNQTYKIKPDGVDFNKTPQNDLENKIFNEKLPSENSPDSKDSSQIEDSQKQEMDQKNQEPAKIFEKETDDTYSVQNVTNKAERLPIKETISENFTISSNEENKGKTSSNQTQVKEQDANTTAVQDLNDKMINSTNVEEDLSESTTNNKSQIENLENKSNNPTQTIKQDNVESTDTSKKDQNNFSAVQGEKNETITEMLVNDSTKLSTNDNVSNENSKNNSQTQAMEQGNIESTNSTFEVQGMNREAKNSTSAETPPVNTLQSSTEASPQDENLTITYENQTQAIEQRNPESSIFPESEKNNSTSETTDTPQTKTNNTLEVPGMNREANNAISGETLPENYLSTEASPQDENLAITHDNQTQAIEQRNLESSIFHETEKNDSTPVQSLINEANNSTSSKPIQNNSVNTTQEIEESIDMPQTGKSVTSVSVVQTMNNQTQTIKQDNVESTDTSKKEQNDNSAVQSDKNETITEILVNDSTKLSTNDNVSTENSKNNSQTQEMKEENIESTDTPQTKTNNTLEIQGMNREVNNATSAETLPENSLQSSTNASPQVEDLTLTYENKTQAIEQRNPESSIFPETEKNDSTPVQSLIDVANISTSAKSIQNNSENTTQEIEESIDMPQTGKNDTSVAQTVNEETMNSSSATSLSESTVGNLTQAIEKQESTYISQTEISNAPMIQANETKDLPNNQENTSDNQKKNLESSENFQAGTNSTEAKGEENSDSESS